MVVPSSTLWIGLCMDWPPSAVTSISCVAWNRLFLVSTVTRDLLEAKWVFPGILYLDYIFTFISSSLFKILSVSRNVSPIWYSWSLINHPRWLVLLILSWISSSRWAIWIRWQILLHLKVCQLWTRWVLVWGKYCDRKNIRADIVQSRFI